MQLARRQTFIIIPVCLLISLTGCTDDEPARMKLVNGLNSNDRASNKWARGVEETESKFSGAASHRQAFKSSFGKRQPQDSSEQRRSCELLARQAGQKTNMFVDAEIHVIRCFAFVGRAAIGQNLDRAVLMAKASGAERINHRGVGTFLDLGRLRIPRREATEGERCELKLCSKPC
jgi:hypothetical protein